ncbi:arylesterase [Mucilaginibacter sp. BJC16-A38]|uniref:arylesterase n=1 Tax=Mucilaginibacter phenanthrenivorans TaxID=1234842 RepID=UPI002158444F|nr:arylesterase [Mucilaginibacter phenanthrenivorans]MCR8560225.1 arylesterase [Mucilaginibacter phenanthrenivorans]
MQNILFFGDSLTAGYGLRNATMESYPAIIGQKIDAEGLGYKIINAGLSGDTSAGGLRRIDYWLSQPVSVFVLELGINDIIRGIPPALTLKNLQAIINKVSVKYPKVKMAVMGMQIPAFIHSPVAAQFSEIFSGLAAANQLSLVPFFLNGVAGNTHLNLPDRLHPNAEGYKVIAENVWPVIKKLIGQLPGQV